MDSHGKQIGFDIIAIRMLEKLETMVSGDHSKVERAWRRLKLIYSETGLLGLKPH